jgi:GDP-D-mannose 3',5'-epimerase
MNGQKTALVCGAGGFIGSHMVKRLKKEGYYVRGVDLKYPEFSQTEADQFVIGDLCNEFFVRQIIVDKYQEPFYDSQAFDEIYQFAADMGGAGFVFTGENDAEIMQNSASINLNILKNIRPETTIFYSSSACMYPQELQTDSKEGSLKESDAYPANPDSDYGWEKLFSERLYLAYARNKGIDIRIARFHNIFGIEGTYKGGREKAPAALCRKVIECDEYETFEIWGTGKQTRSFLYIDECIEGVRRLMKSNYKEPINIGSDFSISINGLAEMIIAGSNKSISYENIKSNAIGVHGRNSDNDLIKEVLGWKPSMTLLEGISKTYNWIKNEINR